MLKVSIDKLLLKSGGSLFRLVCIAAKRAVELNSGVRPDIEVFKDEKYTSVALREIAEGKIDFKSDN